MTFQPAKYPVHLFDIDDTLITTSESYTRAYEKTLRDLTGKDSLSSDVSYEELRTALLLFIKIFGSGLPGRIWEAVYKEAASAGRCLKYSPEEATEQYLERYMGMLSAYSSVEKYITGLKKMNISVGIISNGDYKRQTEKLCAAGLFDLFNPDMIYVSSMFPEIDKKPSPVMIRQWITKHGIQSAPAVYYGDRCEDIVAGNLAGVDAVLMNMTEKHIPSGIAVCRPAYTFSSWEDIIPAL